MQCVKLIDFYDPNEVLPKSGDDKCIIILQDGEIMFAQHRACGWTQTDSDIAISVEKACNIFIYEPVLWGYAKVDLGKVNNVKAE